MGLFIKSAHIITQLNNIFLKASNIEMNYKQVIDALWEKIDKSINIEVVTSFKEIIVFFDIEKYFFVI